MKGMETLHLKAAFDAPECEDLRLAARILREGGTVAFATETVYGLGANALSAEAVAKIFEAKQRPGWDPLIVHIADEAALPLLAASRSSPAAEVLIRRFWPGPLTLLLPRTGAVPDAVTAGRNKVGVRMPAHPVARALLRAAGVPVAAPSANLFGHVSPTCAAHVAADLEGRIDAILDSGPALHGLESTVVDASGDPCIVYRPGAVTMEQLRSVWPSIEPYQDPPGAATLPAAALPSPGVGLRHYAPKARLLLVDSQADGAAGVSLARVLRQAQQDARAVGLMLPRGEGFAGQPTGTVTVFDWGDWNNPAELGSRLFEGLRALDDAGVEVIVCPEPSDHGLGTAILDRLRKAARRD